MATAIARVRLSEGALREYLTGANGVVTRYVIRQTRQITNRAKLYTPVDTGNLRASITSAVFTRGLSVFGQVGTPVEYALAVHEGLEAKAVPVQAHAVRAYVIRAHQNNGRAVPTMTRLASTRSAHSRQQKAKPGRPFLRRALQDVLGV